MKVTTLIENTCLENCPDLLAQHGLSLHIAWDGRQILFDAGASDAFWSNANALGLHLRTVDLAVLSHYHYDHGGGLEYFLQGNPVAKVYLRCFEGGDPYLRAFWIINRYVGLDKSLFGRYPERFEFVSQDTEIAPGVFILTEIEKPYPIPRGNRHLYIVGGGQRSHDDFAHELLLVIRHEDELVVFSGCSHQGVLNMVETVTKRFPSEPIRALFGGFHLIDLPIFNTMAGSKRDVREIGERLLAYPVEKIYTGHCTGKKAYRVLKDVMGERLEYLPTGRIVEI